MAPLTTTTSSISGSVKILVLETDIQPLVGSDKGDIGKAFQELFSRVGKMRTPVLPVSVTSRYVVGNMSDPDAPYGGELPTIDALLEYHGILITGSKHCAHGDAPWILNLLTWLKEAWTTHPHLRFSGVCFGHQILCRLLGSTISAHPTTWEISHTKIQLTALGRSLFDHDSPTLALHQMHQDYVHEAPTVASSRGLLDKGEKVAVWGSTEECPVQGVYIKKRLFTTQGHLEDGESLVTECIEVAEEGSGLGEGDEDVWEAKEKAGFDHDGDVVGRAVLMFMAGNDDELDSE